MTMMGGWGGSDAAADGNGDCIHFLGLLSQSTAHWWLKQQKFIGSRSVQASAAGAGEAGPF